MKNRMQIALVTGLALAALAALGAAPASAEFGLSSFSVTYENSADEPLAAEPSAGEPFNEAGAHANMKTVFSLNTTVDAQGRPMPDERLKNMEVDLPAGFYGDPTVAPSCNVEELVAREGICAPAAQVGVMYLEQLQNGPRAYSEVPVYKLPTTTTQTAQLGAVVLGVLVRIDVSARTDGDYGLTAKVTHANQGVFIFGSELVLWGAPADPRNDPKRFSSFATGGASAGFSPRPFLSLPARCESVKTVVRANSWQHPERWVTATSESPPLTGCDDLVFEPSLVARPQSRAAGEPAALDVDLTIPQDLSVSGRATPQLRRAEVTLPEGVTISPSSAAGLGSCSDAALAIGSNAEPACPDSSKIGTITVDTPVLEEEMTGQVILGEPKPGNLFRLFLVLRGPGLLIKIPGVAKPDPVTGQITTTFDQTPQLPFEGMHLEFKGGPRAPIKLPSACGTYTTHSVLTSWSSPNPVISDSSFTIDQNCGNEGRFTPGLQAGTLNPTAGAFSQFTLRVIGQDGQQNLSRIETTLPEGLLAKLKGVALCSDAEAAAGSCPAASQVGTTTVGAGPGSSPIYVPQPGKAPTAVYLGGPYKGAPLSLVVKVPAQAGPFDLGTVVVRNALHVDPVTTQVTAKSDPLPQILEGIPISYRDVRVEVSRPDFMVNPTDCDPSEVSAALTGIGGATASPSTRFQAASCASLGFGPKLSLSLIGGTERDDNPQLKAVLTARKGDANIGRVQVALPHSEILDNEHIETICTRVQFAQGAVPGEKCPAASVYGYAKAVTPLLGEPIEGPVFLRSSSHTLPDLVAALHSDKIDINLEGRIDSIKGARIRNTFAAVPDAPVTKFTLIMRGGKRGLLVNSADLCKRRHRAIVTFTGQNGKVLRSSPELKASCSKKSKRAARHGHSER